MPENPDNNENNRIAGISTRRCPTCRRSCRLKIANTPHARPSAPITLPPSCTLSPRSAAIPNGNSEAMIQRSSPTSPKPSPSNVTAFHS